MDAVSVKNELIKLTGPAVGEVQRLLAAEADPADMGLRLGIKGGGCSSRYRIRSIFFFFSLVKKGCYKY